MRPPIFALTILACLIVVVAAWSKEDQEIFRLRDEVEAAEGQGVTFYDFLGISPSANQDEINKAYRKKSRSLHPDKVKQKFVADKSTGKTDSKAGSTKKKPGVHVSKGPSDAEIKAAVKAASDRFARLGIVTNILRGGGRERYDHFLYNGFPTWKGTGYYYSRFRPGLGTVLIGLFIFVGGGGHWLALHMTWQRNQDTIQRYITFARNAAWGDNLGIPGLDGTAAPQAAGGGDEGAQPMNRRQRRMQEKDAKKDKSDKKSKGAKASPAATPPIGSTGSSQRVVAENGKILAVDSVGNVYLEQADEDGETHQFLLDPAEFPKPTIRDTALYRLPIWAYKRVTGRFFNKAAPTEVDSDDEAGEATPSSSDADDYEVLQKINSTADNGRGKVVRRIKKTGRGR